VQHGDVADHVNSLVSYQVPYFTPSFFFKQNQCDMYIYRKNTTIFISSIMGIYYIRHNYTFRPLMLAIFRLYVDLPSSYTTDKTYVGCFLGVGKGFVWDRDLVCVSGGVWNSIINVFMPYF
jgi:hypothetical protein